MAKSMTWTEWEKTIAACNFNERKLRLLAVAAVNEIRHLLTDQQYLNAIDTAERYADNNATEEELLSANNDARAAYMNDYDDYDAATRAVTYATVIYATARAADAAHAVATAATFVAAATATAATYATAEAYATATDVAYTTAVAYATFIVNTTAVAHADTTNFQNILNSFTHPITDQNLKTSIATQLAHNIYDNKHFYLMPILADALQDAGCDDQALLAMLQDTTFPHNRGSNVLDFLTGRT